MGPDILTPASTPSQASRSNKTRFKGAEKGCSQIHRFYIISQDPQCSRRIIIKRWKVEMGKGYKEEAMDQKKRKKLKDMKEERNDLCITALSLSESSLSPVQFSGF